MRRPTLLTLALLCAATPRFIFGAENTTEKVKPVVPLLAQTFDLADVKLGPGPFREAQERDRAYLLRLDPDRLLHTFRLNVGLPSSAQPYGGWESPDVELRGHSLGHYLSACALMARSTGDEECKRRVDYIVAELAKCQAASPKAGYHAGYLSAFPESFIDRVEQRKEVWAPWYTLHKIMAGVLDAYQLTGNQQALTVLTQMADWVKFRVDHLTPEQMQAMLQTEFGGMNEVLANLYSVTGDKEHLRLAQAFDHKFVFDPLAAGKDQLDGLHANTQIPKVIGAAREFELTGNDRYRAIAENFWTDVALHRSYVIGGDSDREHFFPVDDFAHHLSPETTETCNTYNMLKLTRHLFEWHPDARTIDFYERGLYNHILASQDPAQGMFTYLMSLEPGHYKTYSTPENSFWCCVGTGMENHAKYGDTIYAHDQDGVFVNLFVPSEVHWRERGVTLKQETTFPEEDATRLTISTREPAAFSLKIRHPAWSTGELKITINGEAVASAPEKNAYAELKRTWKNGDRVEVKLNPTLRTESLPGVKSEVALLYGPIVLAGKLGTDGMPMPYARDQLDQARFPHPAVPVFVLSDENLVAHVKMISRSPLLFETQGLAQPRDVVLEPFYLVQHERETVYWKVLTPQSWETVRSGIAATENEWKSLSTTALDFVAAGDENSESAHAFQSGKTESGHFSNRSWRQAQKGNAFGYLLKTSANASKADVSKSDASKADATKGDTPLTLVCAFGSRDKARKFNIVIDDKVIATPKLDGTAPGEILLQKFAVPVELTRGKDAISVKFVADKNWDGATANVFGCALVANP
ncbi:MAG TPA: beta-L-arabinofuranosidase domain-containing protein [Opitutaceae bacterium]|nr:beta-L-arabinofuranosidase domain-containing protein [Opitutaceae bacterium]